MVTKYMVLVEINQIFQMKILFLKALIYQKLVSSKKINRFYNKHKEFECVFLNAGILGEIKHLKKIYQ